MAIPTDADLRLLTDNEITDLQQRVGAESYRRAVIASAYEQVAYANSTILGSEGLTPGDPWRAPTQAAEAYPLGWVSSHDDKTWRVVAGGTWQEPGTGTDWEEVAADDLAAVIEASPASLDA